VTTRRLISSSVLLTVLVLLLMPTGLEAAQDEINVFSVDFGLMFWTWILFLLTVGILSWKAFPAIAKGLESRTASIEEAIEGAKGDRNEARRLLEEHQRQLDEARMEAKGLLQEGRDAGERLREEILTQARAEHETLLEKARKEMARERDELVASVRRDAIDLSIAAAEQLIKDKLDDDGNRKLVRDYMSKLG